MSLAAHAEPRDTPAVQPDVEVVRLVEIHDVLVHTPFQPNPDDVFAVEWKAMADRDAGARPKRQILAHPVVLRHVDRNDVGLRCEARPDRRVAHRETADPSGRRHVALHQHRREREGTGEVVEAVTRIVSRQQRFPVDVQRQEVTDGVGVLRPVQAMGGDATRLGGDGGGAVE